MVDETTEEDFDWDAEIARRRELKSKSEWLRKLWLLTPTLDFFLEARARYPNVDFDISYTAGIEWLFSYADELRDSGLDPAKIEGFFGDDVDFQAESSLYILEKLKERRDKLKSGETHVVSRGVSISDSLVNYFIITALDQMSYLNELTISRSLIMLIKEQLAVDVAEQEKKLNESENRHKAWRAAVDMANQGERPTFRKIGAKLGVNASTVLRWIGEQNLENGTKEWAELFASIAKHAREMKER